MYDAVLGGQSNMVGHNSRYRSRALASLVVLGVCSIGSAQSVGPVIRGIVEFYPWAFQSDNLVLGRQHLRWTQIDSEPMPNLRFQFGEIQMPKLDVLADAWVEYGDAYRIKVGRFRPDFGQNDWMDLYHRGFNSTHVVKNFAFDGVAIGRYSNGFQVTGGTPKLQYEVGWIDVRPDLWNFVPKSADRVLGRVQGFSGDWIFGASAMLGKRDGGLAPTSIYGLDFQWSVPTLAVRGEYITGVSSDAVKNGYYIDASYKKFGWPKTTLVGRLEGTSAWFAGGADPMLLTLGVRQVVTSLLSVSLNYTVANKGEQPIVPKGFSLQAIAAYRF